MKAQQASVISLVVGLALLLVLVSGTVRFLVAQSETETARGPGLNAPKGADTGSLRPWLLGRDAETLQAGWYTETVDASGNAGWYTSLQLDGSGYPHMSYYDFVDENLKYAYWDGSIWRTEVVDAWGTVGLHTSLALDENGYPHISYHDVSNGDLKYARWSGGSWELEKVDGGGYRNVGEYSSLALDSGGNAHISYYDADYGDLKYAYEDQYGWHIETVDAAHRVGQYSSLVLHDGYAHISYWDYVERDLKYARRDLFGWTIQTVDGPEVGEHTSLALDGGRPHISYYDAGNCSLKHVYHTGWAWYFKTVDNTGCVGEHSSLALDGGGDAHISYWDYANQDLKYAYQVGSSWYTETLDSQGNVGEFSSIALDGDGEPHIAYFDRSSGFLKHAHYSAVQPPATPTPSPTPTPTPGSTPTPTPTASPTPLPVPGTGDAYESDNSCGEAHAISTDGAVQAHTFHEQADTDWVTFDASAGTTYLIEAQVPVGAPTDVSLELYDQCGGIPQGDQDYTFSADVRLQFQAPASGPLFLKLLNNNPLVYGSDVAYHLSVRAQNDAPTPGALVLVAGRIRASDPLQDNIHFVTDAVYQLFVARGYDDEHITYLATDSMLDGYDDAATAANLEQAITTWAQSKVDAQHPFTLFMMDHGGHDQFYLNKPGGEWVTPEEIDDWLAQLEAARPGVTVNVIVEACHSGSFIDVHNTVSRQGRVVISSTGAWNLAYASSLGALFSDQFIESLKQGASLYAAFEAARGAVQSAQPAQTPWLDDDGDGVANEGEDGQAAAGRGFDFAGTLAGEEWKPYVVQAIGPKEVEGGHGVIRAEVRDDARIRQVWAVIYPPSHPPPGPGEEIAREILPTVVLLEQGDNWYGAGYSGFKEIGVYRVVVYAEDRDGYESEPLAIEVEIGRNVYLPLVVGHRR